MTKKGFTLVELLLYVAILTIVSGLFAGILATTTRVQVQESAASEVASQANFVLQTIQRLIQSSSNIEEVCPSPSTSCPTGASGDNLETSTAEIAYLKLRMPVATEDPTCISLIANPNDSTSAIIYVTQDDPNNDESCKNPDLNSDNLTNPAKVKVPLNGLTFEQLTSPPGHDVVKVSLTLDFNTANPSAEVSKSLVTAIGRVSAATFDSPLIPSNTDNLSIGALTQSWKDLFLSGKLIIKDPANPATNPSNLNGIIFQPDNYNGQVTGANPRGDMAVGAPPGGVCAVICAQHTGSCDYALKFVITGGNVGGTIDDECDDGLGQGGICFCY